MLSRTSGLIYEHFISVLFSLNTPHSTFLKSKNLLRKHREIDAPVAPDMSALGFHVLVLIPLLVEVTTEVGILLIEEIGLTNGYPIKGGLRTEQA